jgi:hypothetical protein
VVLWFSGWTTMKIEQFEDIKAWQLARDETNR